MIIDSHLEASALAGVLLKVEHGFEHLAMASRHETNGAEYLEDGHFHFGIVGGQTLRDDFDR